MLKHIHVHVLFSCRTTCTSIIIQELVRYEISKNCTSIIIGMHRHIYNNIIIVQVKNRGNNKTLLH